MRTFQLKDAKSDKFWNIDLHLKHFTVTYGKTGCTGRFSTKTFPTPEKAKAAADKLINEKLAKGYVETTPGVAETAAFERAIAENPDDGAGWRAYADWLIEHNDPRGEFMQVQLALEDESRSKAERKKLQEREAELLEEYEREWLGELAPFMLDVEIYSQYADDPPEWGWQQGFLSRVQVQHLAAAFTQVLATSPAARFLRELRVETDDSALFALPGAPCFRNLRIFQLGQEVEHELDANLWPHHEGYRCYLCSYGLERVIAAMPHIEELHLLCKGYDIRRVVALPTLTHLRVLRVYHLGVRRHIAEADRYEYPLDVLAANPAVANLTHLLFHPHHEEFQHEHYGQPRMPSFLPLEQIRAILRSKYLNKLTHLQLRLSNMGDEGIREVIASGILKRLKWLDLRHGCITDEGAKLLAECPDTKKLEHLDLSRNAVTSTGLKLFRRAGIPARADRPLTAQELTDEHYLREGDFE
jgi:uncharacterized protein (TIGR02996 family)